MSVNSSQSLLNLTQINSNGAKSVTQDSEITNWTDQLRAGDGDPDTGFDDGLIDAVEAELKQLMSTGDLTFEDAAKLLEDYLDADGDGELTNNDADVLRNAEGNDSDGNGVITANEMNSETPAPAGETPAPAEGGRSSREAFGESMDYVQGVLADPTTYDAAQLKLEMAVILAGNTDAIAAINTFIDGGATVGAVQGFLESVMTLGGNKPDKLTGRDFYQLNKEPFTIDQSTGAITFTNQDPTPFDEATENADGASTVKDWKAGVTS